MATLDLTKRSEVPLRTSLTGDELLATTVGKLLYVTSIQTILEAAAQNVDWNAIQNKPTTYPPSAHTHTIANVLGLQEELDEKVDESDLATVALTGDYNDLDNLPTIPDVSGFVPNTRTIAAGTGLTGGGNLTANRTVSLSAASIASLALADTAVQPDDLGDLAFKDVVAISDIGATGVADATTVLHGDGQWKTVSGSGDLLSANNLSDLEDASEARDNLGLGTAALANSSAFATAAQGVLAGTAVQPGDLGDLALLDKVTVAEIDATGTADDTTYLRGDGTWQVVSGGGGGDLLAANNLSDLDDATTARTNLGLGNVNNTSDAAKPVSTATQTALNLKANAANAALTGIPIAPTAAAGTNTTQIATTAFVNAAVAAIPEMATADDVRAGASSVKAISPAAALSSQNLVELELLGTELLFKTTRGKNLTKTLTGNFTIRPEGGMQQFASGIIIIKQDATGGRTLSYSSEFKFQGGAPTLSTAANAVDIIAYYVESSSVVRCTFIKGS